MEVFSFPCFTGAYQERSNGKYFIKSKFINIILPERYYLMDYYLPKYLFTASTLLPTCSFS